MKEDFKFLILYVKGFFSNKKFIVFVVLLFLVGGILKGILSPKIYQSSVSFVAQVSEDAGIGSGLKNIAEVIGLSIGKKDDDSKDLPVYLYPKIVNSLSFQEQIFETPLKYKNVDSSVTFRDYYVNIEKPDIGSIIKKYTIGLPGLLVKSIRGNKKNTATRIDSLKYDTEEYILLKSKLSEVLEFSIDENDGTLSIIARMNEAIPAAQLAESAQMILQNEIIKYRIGKAKEKNKFIDEQYEIKKEEFINAQNALAAYIDRNAYNTTEKSKIQLQKLQSNFTLISSVYQELEQQKLAQSIKIQEDTPLFTTLNPAIVPLRPINGNSLINLLKYIVIGFMASISIYVYRKVYTKFITMWQDAKID